MHIKNIWRGDAGLAVTYWGYGVLGSVLLGIPLAFVTPGSIPAIIVLLFIVLYLVWLHFSIWRAASKYNGPKIWSVLARVAVTLPLAGIVIGIGAAILVPSMSKGNHAQNDRLESVKELPKSSAKIDTAGQTAFGENDKPLPELDLSEFQKAPNSTQALSPQPDFKQPAKFDPIAAITDGFTTGKEIHMVAGKNPGKPYLGFILNISAKEEDHLVLSGNFKAAYPIYLTKSQAGDVSASHNLGLMYLRGLGVNMDLEKSISYLEISMTSDSNWSTANVFYQKALKEKALGSRHGSRG